MSVKHANLLSLLLTLNILPHYSSVSIVDFEQVIDIGACDMETSLKAMRKPSHQILSYASFLRPALLKAYHIHYLEIQIFRYLVPKRNYAIYQIAKLGVANYWNKRNTVQKLGIQMEVDETFFHTVISMVLFCTLN